MSRKTFGSTVRAIARAEARAARISHQHRVRQERENIRHSRTMERQAAADVKEAARLYLLARMEEADALTKAVQERESLIDTLLATGLASSPAIDLLATRKRFIAATFDDHLWRSRAPSRSEYIPREPGFLARLLPGSSRRHQERLNQAISRFEIACEHHNRRKIEREKEFKEFLKSEEARRAAVNAENEAIREKHRKLHIADHGTVIDHFQSVIDRSLNGDPDAVSADIGYSPESKHLVVDLEFPEISAIPEESSFRYVKSGDRIESVARPLAKRKALYGHLLSQISLKCIDTIFRGAPKGIVDCVTLNGMLDTIDPATGQQLRLCLLSVRVTLDTYKTLNLHQVAPEHCLKSLKASVSRAPAELLSVKPIIELDMVDPRFVETLDVMARLDERPNLMELTPTEFEGLITNLFSSMGLDTRQTQASRDGGVDCVAFDSRPVFGGKVVIQAKRYKNTVGVSAVRDLFGTVQNEGASKGILVTTSGYGKAAYDFARGKPLELLDGSNLLHLLAEHAAINARIVMPVAWTDLPVHGD